ncbi:hypothetical protein [Streptomyces sp. PSKA30]|uniref:hypothetical protein n=1 Tax=Streptomyces sp. PSKA30 TaxID=2874597 RepID=UPI0027E15F64|nr:hypothetical protein [Streptomyces sp. PSKA30]
MASATPVVIAPPDDRGGRRVRVDGKQRGTAYSLLDVVALLQEAGLQDWDEMDVVRSSLIEWGVVGRTCGPIDQLFAEGLTCEVGVRGEAACQ